MQGKIYTNSQILGDDGVKYSFEMADFQNLGDRQIADLIGASVDFRVDERGVVKFARNIFIASNVGTPQNTTNKLAPIRKKALIGLGLLIASIIPIPVINTIVGLIGLVMYISAIYDLNKLLSYAKVFKNYLISVLASFSPTIIAVIMGTVNPHFFEVLADDDASPVSLTGLDLAMGLTLVLISLFAFIVALIFYYRFCKEMTSISGRKEFIYSFWAPFIAIGAVLLGALLQSLTLMFLLLIVMLIAYVVLPIIGWVKFKSI